MILNKKNERKAQNRSFFVSFLRPIAIQLMTAKKFIERIRIKNIELELITQAIGSIVFFRETYASTTPAADNAKAVVAALRVYAQDKTRPHKSVLFESVAYGIEVYMGLKPLPEN